MPPTPRSELAQPSLENLTPALLCLDGVRGVRAVRDGVRAAICFCFFFFIFCFVPVCTVGSFDLPFAVSCTSFATVIVGTVQSLFLIYLPNMYSVLKNEPINNCNISKGNYLRDMIYISFKSELLKMFDSVPLFIFRRKLRP